MSVKLSKIVLANLIHHATSATSNPCCFPNIYTHTSIQVLCHHAVSGVIMGGKGLKLPSPSQKKQGGGREAGKNHHHQLHLTPIEPSQCIVKTKSNCATLQLIKKNMFGR